MNIICNAYQFVNLNFFVSEFQLEKNIKIMSVKIKERQSNIKYNPALDKFKDMDIFPTKTQAAKEHLKERDIAKEIEAIRGEKAS